VQRLLVDHPTGSGKTREMICVLENFFYDQRPKIAIFPKAAICHLPAFWFWWCKMAFLPSTVHRITWMMIDGL
jgi:hypothetical protein